MLAIVIGSLDIAKRRLDSDRARAWLALTTLWMAPGAAALLTARPLAFSVPLR